MRDFLLLFVFIFWSIGLFAQNKEVTYRFINANELIVQGRASSVVQHTFHRADTVYLRKLPRRVAELSTNAAGISVDFTTDTKNIKIKWVLGKFNTLWNMTPLAINGLDLYGLNKGKWQYMASAIPGKDTNEVVLIAGLDGSMRSYRLYLPLYAELKILEIGIDSNAVIHKTDATLLPKKKVVIYGSSITQGASASRPGMAYPSILSRWLNIETYNMGFSGSGKMELILADVIGGMDADVYILDCVPNPSPKEIEERAVPFIKRLRGFKPEVPIIMVESIIREQAYWVEARHKIVFGQNAAFKKAYDQLMGEGFKNILYIPADELIGDDHEATVDGTHLTDLGFMRIAERLGRAVEGLLR